VVEVAGGSAARSGARCTVSGAVGWLACRDARPSGSPGARRVQARMAQNGNDVDVGAVPRARRGWLGLPLVCKARGAGVRHPWRCGLDAGRWAPGRGRLARRMASWRLRAVSRGCSWGRKGKGRRGEERWGRVGPTRKREKGAKKQAGAATAGLGARRARLGLGILGP
jgi:hypothetical protein